MLQFVTQSLTLVLPIFVSGIVFIAVLKTNALPALNVPVDCKKKISGKRIFGENKTWRGVAVYALLSVIVCMLLGQLYGISGGYIHPVFSQPALYVGLVFSLSYVAGELANSFVKRQLGIAAGKTSDALSQKVMDNIDGMLMAALALIVLLDISFVSIMVALVVGFFLHEATDHVMKKLQLK